MPNAEFFSIATGSAEPIYRQLVEQLRRRVSSGQMKAGDELPSVRELAQALTVHPMTISKAFGLMEAEGLIERRRGLSMVVAAQHRRPQTEAERLDLLRPAMERVVQEATQLELPAAKVLRLFQNVMKDTGRNP